jgi:hypothetical protein
MTKPIPGILKAWQGILRRDNYILALTPTVDDVLARTHLGGHFHEWSADGIVIRVTRDELRPPLEAAYDETVPDWPSMVEIDDA